MINAYIKGITTNKGNRTMSIKHLQTKATDATKVNLKNRNAFWYKSQLALYNEMINELKGQVSSLRLEALDNNVAYLKEVTQRNLPTKDRDYYLIEYLGKEAFEKLKVAKVKEVWTLIDRPLVVKTPFNS